MTAARPYNGLPSAALLMLRSTFAARSLTWSDLEEFASDLDRSDAEDAWQSELLNAVEEE